MTTIRATAPTRVDLAGGTLDLWPLSQLVDHAVTVNLAIDVLTGCSITTGGSRWEFVACGASGAHEHVVERLPRRPEREVPARAQLAAVVAAHFELPPCRIETWSDAAPGSGLGGSSSLVVGLIAAAARLVGRTLGDAEAVSLACNLETRVLGLPGGSQDHWAAQCGGLSVLEYGPEGTRRTAAPPAVADAVAACLVVADTRVEHHSGMNNWAVMQAVLGREAGPVAALAGVSRAATAMRDAVSDPAADVATRIARIGEALRAEWRARRALAPAVSSPEVERLIAAADAVGAAAKVCGAGGGGCVAALAPAAPAREEFVAALEEAGGRVLRAGRADQGVRIDV